MQMCFGIGEDSNTVTYKIYIEKIVMRTMSVIGKMWLSLFTMGLLHD